MGSFVGKTQEPGWRWHAIEHGTGQVLAYVVGRRREEVWGQLKALREPFGIMRFFPDYWRAYARQLAPETPVPGKHHVSVHGTGGGLTACVGDERGHAPFGRNGLTAGGQGGQ